MHKHIHNHSLRTKLQLHMLLAKLLNFGLTNDTHLIMLDHETGHLFNQSGTRTRTHLWPNACICDQMHECIHREVYLNCSYYERSEDERKNKTAVTAETHAQMLEIQFVKQPLIIMVNFSWKGLKTVVIRESVMVAIMFWKWTKKSLKASTRSWLFIANL